ncbi:MAG: hypothetical protein WDM71_02510 [Ferruginibacter sp.]
MKWLTLGNKIVSIGYSTAFCSVSSLPYTTAIGNPGITRTSASGTDSQIVCTGGVAIDSITYQVDTSGVTSYAVVSGLPAGLDTSFSRITHTLTIRERLFR